MPVAHPLGRSPVKVSAGRARVAPTRPQRAAGVRAEQDTLLGAA